MRQRITQYPADYPANRAIHRSYRRDESEEFKLAHRAHKIQRCRSHAATNGAPGRPANGLPKGPISDAVCHRSSPPTQGCVLSSAKPIALASACATDLQLRKLVLLSPTQ